MPVTSRNSPGVVPILSQKGQELGRIPNPAHRVIAQRTIVLAGVECACFKPQEATSERLIVHASGGDPRSALSAGAPELSQLALTAECEVVAPLYRGSPKYPFPSSVADVLAVYEEAVAPMVASRTRSRIFLSGDGRGGAVALAVATVIRELELRAPETLILSTAQLTSVTTTEGHYLKCAATNALVWQSICASCPEFELCANGSSGLFGYLAGLAPVMLQVTSDGADACVSIADTGPSFRQVWTAARDDAPKELGSLGSIF